MKRHLIFPKSTIIINALLKTGKCKNEGDWIITCNEDMQDMKILQETFKETVKNTYYKDYKISFANPTNYSDFITI